MAICSCVLGLRRRRFWRLGRARADIYERMLSRTTGQIWSSFTRYGYPFYIEYKADLFLQTETDDVPTALMAFQGRLCAGVGKALRLYEIGKKKLLRKAETKVWLDDVFQGATLT